MDASVEVIAFDGDDTLWHSESLFAVTEGRFRDLLTPYADPDELGGQLLATERRNLELFGYGVKGFTLSMVETAIAVSDGTIPASDLGTILAWGKELLGHPVELLDGVAETLTALAGSHRLVLVTKGDLFHQESKIARSGLADLFDHIDIVAEKDAGTYARLAARAGVVTSRMVMVGNSVRSDVVPALEAGASAVHIPYHVTWEHEVAEVAPIDRTSGRHHELADIRQLPELLATLGAHGR